jgi:hypothetical protein
MNCLAASRACAFFVVSPCQLLFRWDNNFSWMAGKSLKYNVEAQKATNELNQLVNAGASSGAGAAASAAAAAQ